MDAIEPALMIDEDDVRKMAASRASINNTMARTLGQSARVTATELSDLYYAQGGRCALSGLPLEYRKSRHPMEAELDHKQKINRRTSLQSLIDGDEVQCAAVADINNLQWVCRFANQIKELLSRSGLDYSSVIASMAKQSESGFPVRETPLPIGNKMRRDKRIAMLKSLYEKHGDSLKAASVHESIAGTELDVAYPTLISELKSIGWDAKNGWRHRRRSHLKEFIGQHEGGFSSFKEFWIKYSASVAESGERPPSSVTVRGDLDAIGIVFSDAPRKRRHKYADISSVASSLSPFGTDWISEETFFSVVCDAVGDQLLAESAISEMLTVGMVEKREGDFGGKSYRRTLCSELAARFLGVSKNRMKKWSMWGVGPRFIRDASGKKSQRYYSIDELSSFKASRGGKPAADDWPNAPLLFIA